MIAPDSSVVIAGFGAWHEHHEIARAELLVTLDRRALANYERCGVTARILA